LLHTFKETRVFGYLSSHRHQTRQTPLIGCAFNTDISGPNNVGVVGLHYCQGSARVTSGYPGWCPRAGPLLAPVHRPPHLRPGYGGRRAGSMPASASYPQPEGAGKQSRLAAPVKNAAPADHMRTWWVTHHKHACTEPAARIRAAYADGCVRGWLKSVTRYAQSARARV
jgi:hypothetical protein